MTAIATAVTAKEAAAVADFEKENSLIVDFDFATAFTNGISDETTEEILPTMNNFPSVKKLASLQINYDGDPKVVISKLVSPFRSEDQPDQQDFLSLTKTACTSVRKGEIVMSTIRRSRLIESIR